MQLVTQTWYTESGTHSYKQGTPTEDLLMLLEDGGGRGLATEHLMSGREIFWVQSGALTC